MWNFLLLASLALVSCNIPQIEDGKCTASRETVRSFYSQHFNNEAERGFTRENIAKKEKFLTPELYRLLQHEFERQEEFVKAHPDEVPFIDGDPFTDSQEYPTGFKVGECDISGESRTKHNVNLFWKSADDKPTQRVMKVEVEKRGGKWLINDFIDDTNESLVKTLGREKYQ